MSEETPDQKYRWTADRAAVVAAQWRAGTPINEIAKRIDATRSAVVAKAEAMQLGDHPSARKRLSLPNVQLTSKQAKATDASARANELRGDDFEERQSRIRLPKLTFLERRFGWE